MAENIDAERAADLAAFAKWKGYELPAFNSDGHFDKDWLHREWVAFCAGRRRTPSASTGEDGLPELPRPIIATRHGTPAYTVGQMLDYARDAIAADRRARGDVVDDLAMLVRQLVHSLKKANPNSGLPARALDYLQRKGLAGSPLRHAAPPLSSEQQAEKGEQ